jgi:hypothetical protein
MDKRTIFYLDCLKFEAGLSQKKCIKSDLKDFMKITQSDEYNAILNSGGVYIGEGEIENTWVAHYDERIAEDHFEEVELIFDRYPTKKDVQKIQFILSIEDYLSDRRIKPYVMIDEVKTHWTLLSYDSPEEKWEQYILIRNEQVKKPE